MKQVKQKFSLKQKDYQLSFTGVKQLIAQGNDLSRELNTCLHTTSVQNKEENQMRELHSWTCDTLHDYLQVNNIYFLRKSSRLIFLESSTICIRFLCSIR
jgi:hypothetical protein